MTIQKSPAVLFVEKIDASTCDSETFGIFNAWVKGEGPYGEVDPADRMHALIEQVRRLIAAESYICRGELCSKVLQLAMTSTFKKYECMPSFNDDLSVLKLLRILTTENLFRWCLQGERYSGNVEQFLRAFSTWWDLKSPYPAEKKLLPEDWIKAVIESGNCDLLPFTCKRMDKQGRWCCHDYRIVTILADRVRRSEGFLPKNLDLAFNQHTRYGDGRPNLDLIRVQALATELFRLGKLTWADVQSHL